MFFFSIRAGKYYKYDFKIYDAKTFIHFAQTGFVNASPHPIPVPESPFDGFVEMGVKALTFSVDNARVLVAKYPYVAIGVASFFGLLILVVFLRSGSSKATDKKKNKESNKSEKATVTKDSKKKKAT